MVPGGCLMATMPCTVFAASNLPACPTPPLQFYFIPISFFLPHLDLRELFPLSISCLGVSRESDGIEAVHP